MLLVWIGDYKGLQAERISELVDESTSREIHQLLLFNRRCLEARESVFSPKSL